jgi:hypothetical protein
MDIFAHALWAGAAITLVRRHRPITARTAALTVVFAVLPDVMHFLPLVAWWAFGDGSVAALRAYATALPGQEPVLPMSVFQWSHHLHCALHSALVAGTVTALLCVARRALWIPLLGWWSHIVIDVFTHSARFYPSPVLYPITQQGFDGIAWNTPWFMLLNYLALAAFGVWLVSTRGSRLVR